MYQILLVDDEPIVKIALRSIVQWEQYGFQICGTASNGEEALAMVGKYNPHVVITDLKMPVMDGIELITSLKKQGFPGEILVLSNFEDFELVRNALVQGAADYLLKVSIDAETLLDRVTKAIHKLQERQQLSMSAVPYAYSGMHDKKNSIVKEFLTQEMTLEQFISSQSEAAFLQEEAGYSLCFVSFGKSSLSSGEFSKSIINSTLIETMKDYVNSLWFTLDRYNLCILLDTEDIGDIGLLKQFAGRLSARFQIYQSLTPAICYDFAVGGFNELQKSYQVIQDALKLGFYGALSIENVKEITPQHYMSFVHYKEVAEEFHQNGSAKLQDSVIRTEDIIKNCKNQHIYPEILSRFFIKVLEYIEFLSKNMNLQTHEYLADMKEYLRFCNSSAELQAHMEQSLQSIYNPQDLREIDKTQIKNEINQALEYIEENYQQKLSLASIAEYVNFSTNYLCRSFKEEVGINVISYINNLRMKKAGELLRQKDSLVKEVSIGVGIDDQLYFSRLFKKYYGMSPSEYKNSYM